MDNDIEKNATDQDCGVNQDMFPCMGKCCYKSDAAFTIYYVKACPCCEISASLPQGASLKKASILS